MVTTPADHFGPIPAEFDPERLRGILVGDAWADRLDCRQWGAHLPHVAGIAGQSGVGAQSVVLSGGYEDDVDGGEWFLYTGSGGRDLSGNKRTNAVQSSDQTFDKMNAALLKSCTRGLPVRVVRSHKEKRSRFAPDPATGQGVRYDGVYTIAAAYRKPGAQGPLVCRYLFVRCDNEPGPWDDGDAGDRPDARAWGAGLPAEAEADIASAVGRVSRAPADPFWGWDGDTETWGWLKPAPPSQKPGADPNREPKKLRKRASEHERALKEFVCRLCAATLTQPLSTPCGHHFCKPCLEARFAPVDAAAAVAAARGTSLRARRPPKPCPRCKADCAEFMEGAQVNVGMVEVIAKLQAAAAAAKAAAADLEGGEGGAAAPLAAGASGSGSGSPEGGAAPAAKAAPAPAAALPSPAKKQQLSAADRDAAALAAEFPGVDAGVVAAVLAEVDGAARDARVLLSKMTAAAAADEKKRAADARKAEKGAGGRPPSAKRARGGA